MTSSGGTIPPLRAFASVAVVAVALGLTACSDDSGSPSRFGSPPPGTSSSRPAPTGSPTAADLKGVLLRRNELPDGWKATPNDTSGKDNPSSGQKTNAALATCTGTAAPPAQNDAGQVYTAFSSGDNLVGSTAKPARTVAARKTFLEQIVASPKANACTAKVISDSFIATVPGAKVANARAVVSGRANGQPDDVVATFVYRATLTVEGDTTMIDSTTVNIVGDRVEAEVVATFFGAQPPAGLVDKAVSAVGERVGKA